MSQTNTILNLDKFRGTVLFSISLRRWGNRARCRDFKAIQDYIAQLEQAKAEGQVVEPLGNGSGPAVILASDRVKSTKVLIKSKTLEAVSQYLNEVKAWCVARSMPSYFKDGMFVVREKEAEPINTYLASAVEKLNADGGPLATFLAAYPDDVEAARSKPVARGGLGPLFRDADYPTVEQMRELFGLDWNWLALAVPENIPDSMKQQEQEKFQKRMLDAAADIESALRAEFQELLEHAEERLTTQPGEQVKRFNASLLGNVTDFLSTFDSRNVFNDDRLAAMVEKAKGALLDESGNPKFEAKKLREYASVREMARASFATMRSEMDKMIEETPSRRFDSEV